MPKGLEALIEEVCSPLERHDSGRPAAQLGDLQEAPMIVGTYPHEVSLEEKTDLVQAIGKVILGSGPGLARALVKYNDYTQEVLIANSEGLFRRDIHPMVFIMAVVLAPDGAKVRLGGVLRGGAPDLATTSEG